MSFVEAPNEICKKKPLTGELEKKVFSLRKEAKEVFLRKDPRFVAIVGPCSIHNFESALHYAKELKKLQELYRETLFIVMRVYVEKARTISGWKGYAYDPDLNNSHNLQKGIESSRDLMLELIKIGLPIAMEYVDPILFPYFQDLVTWGFIGARTPSSQPHRQIASSFGGPMGFKNTLSGDVECALHGILSSRQSHTYLQFDQEGKLFRQISKGNPFCHLVLRGSKTSPNYDPYTVDQTIAKQVTTGIHAPILIDCAHGNSRKKTSMQPVVFRNVLRQYLHKGSTILGVMLESFIKEGRQYFEPGCTMDAHISITDPCISLAETKELFEAAHKTLQNSTALSLY